jgi:hypothetical protein
MMNEELFYSNLLKREIQPLLKVYADRRELSIIAKKLGIKHRSRLTELKNGDRKLTFFWLNIFVSGGIMSVNSITKGRKLNELSEVERNIVLRLDPEIEELTLLFKAKRMNIDVKSLLKAAGVKLED